MRGGESTRRLRVYYRKLRRGTDDPHILSPSLLICNFRQRFGPPPDASQSSKTELLSSTRTHEASTSESLLAYMRRYDVEEEADALTKLTSVSLLAYIRRDDVGEEADSGS